MSDKFNKCVKKEWKMGRKINIANYDLMRFREIREISTEKEYESYHACDFLSYIKHRCFFWFTMNSEFAFEYRIDNPDYSGWKSFFCYQFPSAGERTISKLLKN
jgi:hypothetical protein